MKPVTPRPAISGAMLTPRRCITIINNSTHAVLFTTLQRKFWSSAFTRPDLPNAFWVVRVKTRITTMPIASSNSATSTLTTKLMPFSASQRSACRRTRVARFVSLLNLSDGLWDHSEAALVRWS